MGTSSYKVLRPLRRDGIVYAPGQGLELSAAAAARPLSLGVIIAWPGDEAVPYTTQPVAAVAKPVAAPARKSRSKK